MILGNNGGKWNHLKIIQKIPEQHTWEAHQGTRENTHTGNCAHTVGSTNAEVQNNYHGKYHCIYHKLYRPAATLYHRNMVCVRHTIVNVLHKDDDY